MRKNIMKSLLIITLVLLVAPVLAGERIIPEKVLESWGYKTLDVTQYGHMIKSTSNFKVGGQVYYPRYYLRKECFDSFERAKERMEFIGNYTSNGKDEYRGTFFQAKLCVYQIDPNADIFKYHDKSGVVEKFGKYVQENP